MPLTKRIDNLIQIFYKGVPLNVGDEIRYDGCEDMGFTGRLYHRMIGAHGTITKIEKLGKFPQVFVKWNNGLPLILDPNELDVVTYIPPPPPEKGKPKEHKELHIRGKEGNEYIWIKKTA